MFQTPYRQVVRGTHTATRLTPLSSPCVSFSSAMWLERQTRLRAASSSSPSPLPDSRTAVSLPRLCNASSEPASVSSHTALRPWLGAPHLANVHPHPRRPHERNGSDAAEAATSATSATALSPTSDTSGASNADGDETGELEQWRATALAQARHIVQLVQQQRQAQRLQHALLALVSRHQHLTATSKALGLTAGQRHDLRTRDEQLNRAALEVLRVRRDPVSSSTLDSHAPTGTAASSATTTPPVPREAVVLSLFQEEMTGLLGAATAMAPDNKDDPFLVLTALFDAVLFFPSGAPATGSHVPANELDVGDTTAARQCFDWLFAHGAGVLPRDVFIGLWVRTVSVKQYQQHQRRPSAQTLSDAPDLAAAQWELSSIKRLAQVYPLDTTSGNHAQRDVPQPAQTWSAAFATVPTKAQASLSGAGVHDDDSQRQTADLDRELRALERVTSLQPPSLFPSSFSSASVPRGPASLRVLFDETAFHGRRLEQRLFFADARRGRQDSTPLADLCHGFSARATEALTRLQEARTVVGDDAVDEWCRTVADTLCTWGEYLCGDATMSERSSSSPLTTRNTWYDTRDLFQLALRHPNVLPTAHKLPHSTSQCRNADGHVESAGESLFHHTLTAFMTAAATRQEWPAHTLTAPLLLRLADMLALLAKQSHAAVPLLTDDLYSLVWRHTRCNGPAVVAVYVTTLHVLLLRQEHVPCATRGHLYRLLWCFGCILKLSPAEASRCVADVLECVAASALPHSERAAVCLEVARTATASGVCLSAEAHVALQRGLLLPAALRSIQAKSSTAASTDATPASAPPQRPSWLRRQARWSSAEAWYASWHAQAGIPGQEENHHGNEHNEDNTDDDSLVVLQSSIRCSLALNQDEDAAVLAALLPSVQQLQRRADFVAAGSPFVVAHLATLHALLFFCAMDDTRQCGPLARRLSIELLRTAPVELKKAQRAQWQKWYRRAAQANGEEHAVLASSSASVFSAPTAEEPDMTAQSSSSTACAASTLARSPVHAANTLLRDPFVCGVLEHVAWPASVWRAVRLPETTTESPGYADVFADLLGVDDATREQRERAADVQFRVDSENVAQPSHWSKLCAVPLSSGTSDSAVPAVTSAAQAQTSTTSDSTTVKTHYLAASAAILNHHSSPRRP